MYVVDRDIVGMYNNELATKLIPAIYLHGEELLV